MHDITSCASLYFQQKVIFLLITCGQLCRVRRGSAAKDGHEKFRLKGHSDPLSNMSLSEVLLPVLFPHTVQIQMSYISSKRNPPAGLKVTSRPRVTEEFLYCSLLKELENHSISVAWQIVPREIEQQLCALLYSLASFCYSQCTQEQKERARKRAGGDADRDETGGSEKQS